MIDTANVIPDFAVVTGAARGIGRAIAHRLSHDGHRLVLLDVLEEVSETAAVIPGADATVVDVRDRDALSASFDRVSEAGRLAVLVNCAGTCTRRGFEEMSLEEWRRDIDTNLTAVFLACQLAVFPHMRDQQYGRLVNIASVSGKVGGVGAPREGTRSGAAYAASKAGVINLTRWIAREVGCWNITCNCVAPGPIQTEMTSGAVSAYALEEQPISRFGSPAEVADAVAYLVHPERGYTTGVCLHVDGGLVMA